MGNDRRVIDMNELVKKRIDALGIKMQRPENSGFVDGINADSAGVEELVDGVTLEQLNYLRPVMEEIAGETGQSVEDVFIKYMDLASTVAAKKQEEFEEDFVDFADPTKQHFRF